MARRLVFLAMALLTGPLAAAASAASVNWSSPQLVDHQQPFSSTPMINAVTCPSPRLCVGVEDTGVVTSTRPTAGPGAWSATSFVGVRGYSRAVLGAVSCASRRFCVVADLAGDVFTSTDPTGGRTAWKHTRTRDSFAALSCPSRKLCVAVGDNGIVTSTNPTGGPRAWKTVPDGQSLLDLVSIDCAGAHLCVATGTNDDAPAVDASTNPTGAARAWKVSLLDDASLNFAFSGISCPSVRLCLATDADGNVVSSTHPTRGGGAWKVHRIDGVERTVSCPSVKLCVSASTGAVATSTHPTGGARAWHTTRLTDPLAGVVALSCATASECVAVDWGENVLSSTAPTGGSGSWTRVNLGHGSNALTSVACPEAALCIAVDDAGNVLTTRDPTDPAPAWSIAHVTADLPTGWPPYAHGLASVSCPTSAFCAAASDGGVLTSTDPTGGPAAWTNAHLLVGAELTQISCPSAALCVAGDSVGDVVASADPQHAGAWKASLIGEPPSCDKYDCNYDPISSVSCASEQLCAATDGARLWVSTDPTGGPGAWRRTDLPVSAAALSCPTPSLCVLASSKTVAATTDPSSANPHWTKTPLPLLGIPTAPLISGLSCASSALCVAIDSSGGYAFAGDPTVGAGTWTVSRIDPPHSSPLDNPTTSPRATSLRAVSCQAVSFCLAVDALGRVLSGQAS